MREIKFRAWVKHYGEDEGFMLDLPMSLTHFDCEDGFGAILGNKDMVYFEHYEEPPIMELMQFTGLLDRNGVEIYEGDIVRLEWITTYIGKVRFSDGAFSLYCTDQNMDIVSHLCSTYADRCEVIGNIHKNSELLK